MRNKSDLMKNAWIRARNLAFMEGGTAKEWFAYALTQVWKMFNAIHAPKKATPNRVDTKTVVTRIKDWFVNKNFDVNELMTYQAAETIETLQETEKAVFIKITGSYGKSFTTWLPKSCIAY